MQLMFARAGLFVELYLKDNKLRAGLRAIAPAMKVAFAGATAAVAAVAWMVKLAAAAETTATSFRVLIGDTTEANKVLAELKKFGAETPFEFPELANAGKKLLAFGVGTRELLPTLKRLGDVSSGLGIPIEELSEIYGKARVQGRLFAEDMNQLTGRGIPIIQEFAKQFGVAESEVRGLVTAGKIGFPELEKAFISMTGEGGKFHKMMEAQSKTMAGQLSTLTDNFTQSATSMGFMAAEGMDLATVLKELIKLTEDFAKELDNPKSEWAGVFRVLGEIAKQDIRNLREALDVGPQQNKKTWSDLLKEKGVTGNQSEFLNPDIAPIWERPKVRDESRPETPEEARQNRAEDTTVRRGRMLASTTMDILDAIKRAPTLAEVMGSITAKPYTFDPKAAASPRNAPVLAPGGDVAGFPGRGETWDSTKTTRERREREAEERETMREHRAAPVKGFDVPDEFGFEDDRRRLFEEAMSAKPEKPISTGSFSGAVAAMMGNQRNPMAEAALTLKDIKRLMHEAKEREVKRDTLFEKLFEKVTS